MTPIPDSIAVLCVKYEPVGSRVTCKPALTTTDEDWLPLTGRLARLGNALRASRFELGGSVPADTRAGAGKRDKFESWRLGTLNLIVTDDAAFYDRFMVATDLARQFNLLEKADRIALFQAVLYGK